MTLKLSWAKLQEVLVEWAQCHCDEAYTGRDMTDPHCRGCELREDLPQILEDLVIEIEDD